MPDPRALARAAIGFSLVAACSPPARPAPPPPIHVVATQRARGGGRLVVVAEDGARVADLVPAALTVARDTSAAFSPDGAWVAFESSRARGEDLRHTSLWVVAARLDATPLRLTSDDAHDDLQPAWTPDGKALVFASNRGGSIDLWRLDLVRDGDRLRPAGPPTQLTTSPGVELSPAVAADGRIAFASIERDAAGDLTSAIAVLDGGAVREVTRGPADTTPAWSPDGATLAFSAPIAREDKSIDADVLAVDAADGGHRRVLLEAVGTDESGPVWSADGRWLFATSLRRKVADGRPLLSSIVYVDAAAPAPRTVRMLRDPSAVVSRLGVALAPVALDARALAKGPEYGPALEQILIHAMIRNGEDAGGGGGGSASGAGPGSDDPDAPPP